MRIQTTRRNHFTSTRMTVIKGTIASVGEDVEKLELSDTAAGGVRWCWCFKKQFSSSSRPLSVAEGTSERIPWYHRHSRKPQPEETDVLNGILLKIKWPLSKPQPGMQVEILCIRSDPREHLRITQNIAPRANVPRESACVASLWGRPLQTTAMLASPPLPHHHRKIHLVATLQQRKINKHRLSHLVGKSKKFQTPFLRNQYTAFPGCSLPSENRSWWRALPGSEMYPFLKPKLVF